MRPGASVLTIELKLNLLAPAAGVSFVARGRVIRAGKTIVVAAADVFATPSPGASERLVATMLATLMTLEPRVPRAGAE